MSTGSSWPSLLSFGEGDTPRHIADPDRRPPTASDSAAPTSSRKRWAKIGGGVLVVLLLLALNPFFGFSFAHVTANTPFESDSFFRARPRLAFARAGQKIHFHYDARVKSGELQIRVYPYSLAPSMTTPNLCRVRVDRTSRTSFEVTAPRTGLYSIDLDAFHVKGVYDIDYQLTWYVW